MSAAVLPLPYVPPAPFEPLLALAPAATLEPMRVGSHCRLDSIASIVARARYVREQGGAAPPPARPCRCIACGCRLLTTLRICAPCSTNEHRDAGGRPWDDAVSVRAAASFGDWPARLAVCERCRRPGRHGSLAACVAAAAGDDRATEQVFTRLHVWIGVERRRRREVES